MPTKPLDTIPLARCTACGRRVLNPTVGTPCPECGGRLATWDYCVACGKLDWLGTHQCDPVRVAHQEGAMRGDGYTGREPTIHARLAAGAAALGRAEPTGGAAGEYRDLVERHQFQRLADLRVGDFVLVRPSATRRVKARVGRVVELRGNTDPVTVAWDGTFSDAVPPQDIAGVVRGWRAMREALRRGASIGDVRGMWGRIKPESRS